VLTARTEALEVEIAESERRLELLDERSRSGAVASFRDQEALAIEIAAVAKRKGELEDSELEIMEELEPHDVALAANDAEIARILEARRTCTDRIASAEEEIALEETTVRSRREEAAARVPEPLLSEYERLRAHLGGIGVARVVGGNCSGCNLHLSATELDRIGHLTGPALEHCDQCGRLLVL
jgi:predicted  nucleic acid-binding Zn-ribbon protein